MASGPKKAVSKKQTSVTKTFESVSFKSGLQEKMVALFLNTRVQTNYDIFLTTVGNFISTELKIKEFSIRILDGHKKIITWQYPAASTPVISSSTHVTPIVRDTGVCNQYATDGPLMVIPINSGTTQFGHIECLAMGADDYFEIRYEVLQDLAGLVAMVLEFIKERSHEKIILGQKTAQLEVMHDMGELINSITDMSKLLNIVINMVRDVMDVEICTLMMIDETTNKLVLTAQGGLSDNIEENFTLFTIWEELADWIIKKDEAILVSDISKDTRFASETMESATSIRSFISVPLRVKGKINGILNANKKKKNKEFVKEDMDLFATFANQVAKAIESAQLYEDLQEIYLSTITSLVSAIEAKDPYTHGHSERVAKYAVEIARAYGPPYDKKEIEVLNYAAILHDIGKIGIKEQILNKIEPLLDEEFLLIRSHPTIGAEIIKPIKFLHTASEIAHYHHERYDGKGYPEGIKGEDIPLGARLICVADSFDAMTSTRAYRGRLPEEVALKELEVNKGKQFDPHVVDVFMSIFQDMKRKGIIQFDM